MTSTPDPLASLLVRLEAWLADGREREGGELERRLIARAGGDVKLWTGLGDLYVRRGRPGRALEARRRASALAPGDLDLRLALALALAADGRWPEACEKADSVAASEPSKVARLDGLAALYEAVLQPQRAFGYAQQAAAMHPGDADRIHRVAALHRQLGNFPAARAGALRSLSLDPLHAGAMWLRSDLGGPAGSAPDAILDLGARIAKGLPPAADIVARYALSAELEREGRWPEAFAAVASGAERMRAGLAYDVAADVRMLDALTAIRSSDVAARAALGLRGPAPVFVVGLPRTGTSLVERMLGAHPAVRALGEPPAFDRALFDLAAPLGAVTQTAARLSALRIDPAELGRRYLREAGVAPGERVVDKRPLNALNVGAIAAALPDARIVLVEREPMDAGWALYKALFAPGAHPFSYDLGDLAAFIVAHRRLADHWATAFPGVVLRLPYEDVVANVDVAARRTLEHCRLPWNAACARPHESDAYATSASAVQVRRPVHADSVGRWRRYAEELAPLRKGFAAASEAEQAGKNASRP